ncbi:MAG: class II fructose-bisphosphatase [Thermoleophilia bacterium]|nr:class II fructose-bisphosphatase [Thermoleophilia bacterium]
MCSEFIGPTEAAALAAARWMGQGDGPAADSAAGEAMRAALERLDLRATVVIGEAEAAADNPLKRGTVVGDGRRVCDLALDPLEGTDLLARGQAGAMSVLAAGEPGGIMAMPDMYMQKIVVGPRAAGVIDIDRSATVNLQAIAKAYGRRVGEITAIILDRPRHEDLIAEIRRAGARIKLIADGDITAGIAAAVSGTGDHVYIGIGGAAEGVIAAAALRCLGGEMRAKLWPLTRRQVEEARAYGIDDIEKTLTTEDLVKGDLVFAATGVTEGEFLKRVNYFRDGARTQTLIMCTRCRWVRFVDTIHLFTDERRAIRL